LSSPTTSHLGSDFGFTLAVLEKQIITWPLQASSHSLIDFETRSERSMTQMSVAKRNSAYKYTMLIRVMGVFFG
jgi:hypothetical protein